jgi:hypothetical protein
VDFRLQTVNANLSATACHKQRRRPQHIGFCGYITLQVANKAVPDKATQSQFARETCCLRQRMSDGIDKLITWYRGKVLDIDIVERVELLLCNDREMGGYNRVVSGQWLIKHVPVARQ